MCHDAHVCKRAKLKEVQSAHLKSPTAITESAVVGPLILCDQASPLTENLVKPFANVRGTSEAGFNYYHFRTRHVEEENAFGWLKACFRLGKLPNKRCAIRASCTLHTCEAFRDTMDAQWEQDRILFEALRAAGAHEPCIYFKGPRCPAQGKYFHRLA